jgi:hypothetical protein
MDDPAVILSELTPENSGDWQRVGDVMRRLNQMSEVSADGRPWHDVMLEALAVHGHQMSSGHLHRIRRAFHFLEEGMTERGVPKERAGLAKISSLDQAERLFQLDREAGLDALEACLDIKKPATKADIQKRYEDYLAAHPEKKTPMQAAWDRRRSKQDQPACEVDDARAVDETATDVAAMLRRFAEYVTDLETTAQKDAVTIAALKQEISDINAELTRTKQELQIFSEESSDIQKRRAAGWD